MSNERSNEKVGEHVSFVRISSAHSYFSLAALLVSMALCGLALFYLGVFETKLTAPSWLPQTTSGWLVYVIFPVGIAVFSMIGSRLFEAFNPAPDELNAPAAEKKGTKDNQAPVFRSRDAQ